ncbi:hypothetical protein AB0A60_19490 [Streptomyces sp. NPDC046275]|uniref:hypothetical protein n=1 Tax=Streptomyces sp. NPDC046275 TaxID=3157201 RepID=UPI0033CE4DE6
MNVSDKNDLPGVPAPVVQQYLAGDEPWPTDRQQAEELIGFISDRLEVIEARGSAENLVAGATDLLTNYAEILPHLDNAVPDYSSGVADGLGQALRYLACAWHHHPDFKPYFAPQTPATAEAWTA